MKRNQAIHKPLPNGSVNTDVLSASFVRLLAAGYIQRFERIVCDTNILT